MGKGKGMPYLNRDVMFRIFLGLPTSDVQKGRYGCKEWNKIVEDSHFISTHLSQSKPSLIAIPAIPDCYGASTDSKLIKLNDKKVTGLNLNVENKQVLDTCNGLVLLEEVPRKGNMAMDQIITLPHKRNLFVANPAMDQMVRLPLPPTPSGQGVHTIKRGIIFIDSTNEYKVVSVFINNTGSLRCHILTLGTYSWKQVTAPLKCIVNWESKLCSIKQMIHLVYLGTDEVNPHVESVYMVSFDAADEKFYRTELPSWCSRVQKLHEVEGCPALVVPGSSHLQWDVWVLKNLGFWEQKCIGFWEQKCIIGPTELSHTLDDDPSNPYVVATLENGRYMIFKHSGRDVHYAYDVELKHLQVLEIDSQKKYAFLPHVESLVSPPKAVASCSEPSLLDENH